MLPSEGSNQIDMPHRFAGATVAGAGTGQVRHCATAYGSEYYDQGYETNGSFIPRLTCKDSMII